MPKVSVIIPVYGVEKYLREALDSVINQTLKDIEIIVIDDGGKDKCPQIIDEYASKDSRIIAIHKQNGGYGQTCNIGLEKATGEYIAIMEPDDYIDSHMYEDLYNIAVENNSDIVKSCFYNNLQEKNYSHKTRANWLDYIPEHKNITIKEYPYFFKYHPSIWSAIYKKEFLNNNNIRFTEAPGAGWTDNPFQVQTMCLAKRMNYTQNAYYYWRVLHANPSKELNDYKVPLKRSDEINEWLRKNNINDDNILAFIYKRELAYIKIVLGIEKISDIKDCYRRIKDLCLTMDKSIIFNNKNINRNEKKLYKQCLTNLKILRLRQLYTLYRKEYFQIHINKKEILIKLFGKTIISKENKN